MSWGTNYDAMNGTDVQQMKADWASVICSSSLKNKHWCTASRKLHYSLHLFRGNIMSNIEHRSDTEITAHVKWMMEGRLTREESGAMKKLGWQSKVLLKGLSITRL